MKYLFCLVLLMSQAPLFLYAQSNYKPGYVVNSKNDTLKGFIDYREWDKNPTEINFKQTPTASLQKFTIANANAFAITDAEYYEKFIVKVSTSGVELEKLSQKLDTAYTTDTVFLKNLVNGKNVSLFALTNKIKSSYYILDKHVPGINYLKQYLYFDEEHQSVANANLYINQLLRLAYEYQPGDKKILASIRQAKYLASTLSGIAIALNGGNTVQQTIYSTTGIRFFAGTGIRYNKLQFNSPTGRTGPFNANNIHDNSVSPVLTAGLDFLMNKYTEKFVFRLELTATMNHYQFSETLNGFNPSTSTLDFKTYQLSTIPQIVYNFYAANKLKAFFDIGLAMNIHKYNNYNFSTTYVNSVVINQNKYPAFEGFGFAIPVKAGVQINKRVELYGTYWLPSSISQNPAFAANQSSFQTGVNYIFK